MGGYDGLALAMYDTNDQVFTDKGADKFHSIVIADATTISAASWINPFYAKISSTGSKSEGQTGARQYGFAAEIYLGGALQSGWTSGYWVIIRPDPAGAPTAMTVGTVCGYGVCLNAMGIATSFRVGFHALSQETSTYQGDTMDAAFFCESGGGTGTWGSLLGTRGTLPPNYFLWMTTASDNGRMYVTDVTFSETKTAGLRCNIQGTTYYIALFATCT